MFKMIRMFTYTYLTIFQNTAFEQTYLHPVCSKYAKLHHLRGKGPTKRSGRYCFGPLHYLIVFQWSPEGQRSAKWRREDP